MTGREGSTVVRGPVRVETTGAESAGRSGQPGRPWYADFSFRRDGGGYRPSPWLKLTQRFLDRFFRLALVPRSLALRTVAETHTHPTTEFHHHLYCRPWAVGRDHLDYLVRRGLKPEHRLLDFGCGTLRSGIWLIRHLEAGNYFGIDTHRPSLDIAADYEIPLHGLEANRPRLLHSPNAQVDYFGVKFDVILLLAVLIHLAADAQHDVLTRLAAALAPGGRIVVWRFPKDLTDDQLKDEFGLTAVHREITRSRFGDFEMDWVELQQIGLVSQQAQDRIDPTLPQ